MTMLPHSIDPANSYSSNIVHAFFQHGKFYNPFSSSLVFDIGPEPFQVVRANNASTKDKIVLTIRVDRAKTSTLKIYDYSCELQELLFNEPWITEFYQKAAQLNDTKSILPYYKEINKIISEKKYSECNCFLSNIKVADLSDLLLVGILRLTFSWKNELPAWSLLLENSKAELENRNYDSKSVLRGLI